MRKLIVAVILLIGVIFIITQFAELETILETLTQGDWRFISLAFFLEAVWLINVAASYKAIYRALGVDESIKAMFFMAAAAIFINVVTPTGGMGGVAVFISEADRRGYSTGRATVAGALYILFDYVAFIFVLIIGLTVLFRRDHLEMSEVIASVIFVGIAVVLATLLYLGTRSEQALGNALAWLTRPINWLARPFLRGKRREYIPEARAHSFAKEAAEGLVELKSNPICLMLPLLLALSSKALWILILSLVFLAFNIPISIGTIIAGFCIAFLFMIVSPTPSGVGIVEGTLMLTLASFYIPLAAAAVIAITYRAITFWVPLFIGMFAMRWVAKRSAN